jgi:hypothetical protein
VSDGHKYKRNELHHWSPEKIFAEDGLYTTKWGRLTNTEIERFFFGKLDDAGSSAIEYFANFQHPSVDEKAFNSMLPYMSVQKLRTPKGIANLRALSNATPNEALILMQRIRQLYCAIWTECVWQIADASNSPTKFILSDHPVTVYNRACPPFSKYCVGHNDPDIRMAATHTMFPLSIDKILILTNLNWVRDPHQNELRTRPNPRMLRDAMFSYAEIQTDRVLTEDEVLMMNLIIKRRAYRYIAAAEKEWLYPERHVSNDHWKKFGDGYLLMPEPRLIHMGGQMIIGYRNGKSDAFGEYGHKPWQKGYKDDERERREGDSLDRFQSEWALLRGARYAAEDFGFMRKRRGEDDEEDMERHRALVKSYARKRR